MKFKQTREISVFFHVIAAAYNFLFIYTPLHNWHYGLSVVQWGTFPLLLLTGLWMIYGKKIHARYK